ncbi:MAG: PD40 domain-containing protein [Elusimicrobia bacterium]|nr:PD40 domain-containing protein [Elusimicrobiota bacterium]
MLSALIIAIGFASSPVHAGPAEVVSKARALLGQDQRYNAYILLWSAVDKYPSDLSVQKTYQLVLHNRGDYADALSKYYWRWEKDRTPLNAYLLARIDNDRARTADTVRQGLASGSKHPGLLAIRELQRAEDLAAAGKYESALKLLDASQEVRTMEPGTYRQARAGILQSLGRLDEAWIESVLALAAEPFDASARGVRFNILQARGDADALADETRRTWGLGEFAMTHLIDAARNKALGAKDGAEANYRQALAAKEDNLGWHNARMTAYHGLEDWDNAVAEAEASLALNPYDYGAAHLLAENLRRQGQPDEADRQVEALYARNPRHIANIAYMANLHHEHGRYREAEKLYTQALRLAPGLYDLWIARAATRSYLNDNTGAEEDLQTAENFAHGYEPLDRNYGRLLMNAGRWNECRNRFANVARHGYDDFDALLGYARCSIGDNRFEKGLALYERARKKAVSPEEKRQADSAIDWARGALAEHEKKYKADAWAEVVKVGRTDTVDAPDAVFFDGKIRAGTAWNDAPLAAVPSATVWPSFLGWTRDGRRILEASSEEIREIDPSTATSRVIRRVEKPKPGRNPLWRSIRKVAASPRSGKIYDVEMVRDYSYHGHYAVNEIDAATGKARELHRRPRHVGALWADPDKPRLLLLGEGNEEIDLTTGKVKPLGTIGCRLDVQFRPGASDEAACVSADANAAGHGELVHFDFRTNKKTYLGTVGDEPSWSPDGKQLAYLWRDRELRIRDHDTGAIHAYRLPFGADPTWDSGESTSPTQWSPDGRYIYYTIAKPELPGTDDRRHSVVLDLKEKKAWVQAGPLPNFSWRPPRAPKR